MCKYTIVMVVGDNPRDWPPTTVWFQYSVPLDLYVRHVYLYILYIPYYLVVPAIATATRQYIAVVRLTPPPPLVFTMGLCPPNVCCYMWM